MMGINDGNYGLETAQESCEYILSRIIPLVKEKKFREAYSYAWQLAALIYYAGKQQQLNDRPIGL